MRTKAAAPDTAAASAPPLFGAIASRYSTEDLLSIVFQLPHMYFTSAPDEFRSQILRMMEDPEYVSFAEGSFGHPKIGSFSRVEFVFASRLLARSQNVGMSPDTYAFSFVVAALNYGLSRGCKFGLQKDQVGRLIFTLNGPFSGLQNAEHLGFVVIIESAGSRLLKAWFGESLDDLANLELVEPLVSAQSRASSGLLTPHA